MTFFSLKVQLVLALVVMVILPIAALEELTNAYVEDARRSREEEFTRAARDVFHVMEERPSDTRALSDAALKAFGNDPRLDGTDLAAETAITQFEQDFGTLFSALIIATGDQVRAFGLDRAHAAALAAKMKPMAAEHPASTRVNFANGVEGERLGVWEEWEVVRIGTQRMMFFHLASMQSYAPMIVHTSHGKGVAFYTRPDAQRWPVGAALSPLEEHWESRGEAKRLAERYDERAAQMPDVAHAGGQLLQAEQTHLFVAPSYDRAVFFPDQKNEVPSDAALVAVIEDDELYKGLGALNARRDTIVLWCLAIAVLLAWRMASGYQRSIARIATGIEAMGRGEWQQLQTHWSDVLGKKLVRTLNHAMQAASQRTREQERETWLALLRNVAHEVNNTLSPIKAMAQSMGDGRKAELIVERADALAGFVARCSELARLPPPTPVKADFAALVRSVVAAHEALFAERGVTVELSAQTMSEEASLLAFDVEQMERVVVNLLRNALDAARAKVAVDVGGDTLRISDDGPGFTAEAQAKLFVPFFTTKPHGSGLGLALARQIVLAHGGALTLVNTNPGAVATVELPHG